MRSPFVGGRLLLFVGGRCPLSVLGVVCGRRVSFVGSGARSGCWVLFVSAGFLFVGTELSFVGCGARSRVVHVCGWGGCCLWVGCHLWVRWHHVVCCVITVSEIGQEEGGHGTHYE
jgi:hypothetical protein